MCIFYLYFVILIFLNNLQTIFNQTNVHIINIMNTKYSAILLSGLILSADICPCFAAIQSLQKEPIATEIIQTQWKGKKVAFLGDSITDKSHVGTTKNYWQYLEDMLGLEALVYGLNGHNWIGVLEQAQKLKEEKGDQVDAIIIFAGTNDYNEGIPLGDWFRTEKTSVEVAGPSQEIRLKRIPQTNDTNFRGRINKVMAYLKENYPTQQIILLTPIHRAQAYFGNDNIQPEEAFPNKSGLYVDSYVDIIKETSNIWAVPVIDLHSISGLYPMCDSQASYFHNEKTDRLHPNASGHYRMAKALTYQLLAYPANFK